MSRRSVTLGVLVAVVCAAGAAAWQEVATPDASRLGRWLGELVSSSEAARPRTRAGGMDLTFLVTSDTHFGYQDIASRHRHIIHDMNAIAGRPWPAVLGPFTKGGGVVGTPSGVLVSGDLTEDGRPEEWAEFVRHYGHRGGDGLLQYPVFEGHGNHDKHHSWYVKERIAERHGAERYAWDWGDVHLVCLGEAPDDDDLAWLAEDLTKAGKEVGVVLYFHFPLAGPYSKNWFGDGPYREHLRATIDGYRILGIFHGHYHASGMYRWHGYDVYNVGSAKHHHRSYAVVHVSDTHMTVGSWNYERPRFWWWHRKPIFGGTGGEQRYMEPGAGLYGAR